MMRIDIDKVLKERMPRHYRYIPPCVVRWLKHIICQDDMNALLEHNASLQGADFAQGVINDLGVTFEIRGDRPTPTNRRVILVSNHPLGGLDGLVMACAARQLYGDKYPAKFVVNDLLNFIEPLRPIFLGINKHGKQSRESAENIDEAFAGEYPIIMFPAGLVSRRGRDGIVSDLPWRKMAVVRAISAQRDIIPVHFSGHNSEFFYKFAHLRTQLGMRFNIEMVRLPKEVFLSKGAHFVLTFGNAVPWQSLKGGRYAYAQAEELRSIVYELPSRK